MLTWVLWPQTQPLCLLPLLELRAIVLGKSKLHKFLVTPDMRKFSNFTKYEKNTTQISRPDPGCLQYHTGLTGRMTSFNFIPTSDNHLRNQK